MMTICRSNMWVTIYTDASHTPSTDIGAWAFWAKSERGRVIKSGVFKNKVIGSTWAEMYCILNALTAVKRAWPDVKGFHIVTDSLFCVQLFNGVETTKLQKKKYSAELELFATLTKDIKVKIKHQKGHSGKSTMKAWLNDWCDKAAKLAYTGELYKGTPAKAKKV